MSFLVRKINKRNNLEKLNSVSDIKELTADIPTNEFKTKQSCISTWYIDSIDNLDEAVLAIAVTSSEISKMDFIAMNTDIIKKHNLTFNQTYAGEEIAVPDLQDTHYDIQDVSLKKLQDCCSVYKEVLKESDIYLKRYSDGEIRDIIKRALATDRVNVDLAHGKIKEAILKLKNS